MHIALIGNCQVQTLAVVAGRMLDDATIHVFDYSEAYSHDEFARLAFAEEVSCCDYIFTQTALLSHTNERDLRERYGNKVVTIANFYFRGLFPDSCYVGGFGHRLDRPSSVNSIIVLDAFRRGLSADQAMAAFRIDTLHRLGLLDAWQSSMAEMRRREANNVVDVPGAVLMEDACRSYPAFLTMNHPSAPLLCDYLSKVFDTVGVRHSHINALSFPDPLAHHDTTPVLDMVAEHQRLPYRTAQRWKINSLDQRFVGLEEYVSAFYAAYRAVDPRSLLVHSPTDVVPRLRADPDHAFLVDPAAAPAPTSASTEPAVPPILPEALRYAVSEALASVFVQLEETRLYTHRMHSYLEVMDPKVERLAAALPRLERIDADLARCLTLLERADGRRRRLLGWARRLSGPGAAPGLKALLGPALLGALASWSAGIRAL